MVLPMLVLLCIGLISKTSASTTTQKISHSFALQLFQKTAQARPKDNILISPLSASLALGMVLNGASGKNRQEMARVLGTTADGIDSLNARNKGIIDSLNANKQLTIEVANAVYSDQSTSFRRQFIDFCKSAYGADAASLNFKNKVDTLNVINSWSSDKTRGKIPTILSDLDDDEKMVLLNAIYFKGRWAKPFYKLATKEEDFKLENKQMVKTKMMHSQDQLRYLSSAKFNAVAIPYIGGKQSMFIFLPNDNVPLAELQDEFTDTNWQQWMSSFRSQLVNVSLPKLTINFSDSMGDTLQAMGMQLAFTKMPGLFDSLITSPAKAGPRTPGVSDDYYVVWINRVIQKTFMEVSEEGTEAAAVTAVAMGAIPACAPPPPKVIDFRVDHPYILALVDEPSGEILFLGKIYKPQ